MNSSKYSDNELHLMSYQELRRLSILLQLPANIKKKYMISMIQAHQKGDGCTKTAIANKIMEERKVKRLGGKGKHPKSFMLGAATTQQIPTDLSVSTKHEFETRFSYVAHYTSKDNINSGISRIIKQEAEVSRRNRSIIHQSRKPTRKLSTVGRTEIMLPRNHSLTTPVRLMPQYERNYAPAAQYEAASGVSNGKNHYQDATSYNYHFHGEYSNAVIQTTSHELCRNEPYWTPRDVGMYNNSLMPILSSLLTPNPVTINSSVYASQYTSQNIMKAPTSFQQGVYEKYIKTGSVLESQLFQSGVTNSSTVIVNNHFPNDDNNNSNNNNNNTNSCSVGNGSYLVTKSDVDLEINSALNEMDCQQYNRRNDTVIRNGNGSQECVIDFYLPRNGESVLSSQQVSQVPQNATNVEDLSQCNDGYFRTENRNGSLLSSAPYRPYETSPVTPHDSDGIIERENNDHETATSMSNVNDYESVYIEEDKFWEESENVDKKSEEKNRIEKDNFVDGLLTNQTQGSFLSEISENSTDFSGDVDLTDPLAKNDGKENVNNLPLNFSRCHYSLGHNKCPEVVSKSNETPSTLPSFLSTFYTNGLCNRTYSICKNSFTGTTETHLTPIMTCTYATQFGAHSNSQQTHNSNSTPVMQRQWLYSYPEPQVPFSMESATYTTWDEFSEMGNKIVNHSNNHEVQVVKCRKHGCHYLYSVANPCNQGVSGAKSGGGSGID